MNSFNTKPNSIHTQKPLFEEDWPSVSPLFKTEGPPQNFTPAGSYNCYEAIEANNKDCLK